MNQISPDSGPGPAIGFGCGRHARQTGTKLHSLRDFPGCWSAVSFHEHPHCYSDLHATIPHKLVLNYEKMEFQALGRTMKLVEEGGGPIMEVVR